MNWVMLRIGEVWGGFGGFLGGGGWRWSGYCKGRIGRGNCVYLCGGLIIGGIEK